MNLEPNVNKILDTICFVIAEARERSKSVDQYDIVKTIFLADKKHLNKYGRPITFDNYHAMKFGPVPSLTYNFLKEDQSKLKKYGIKNLKWTRKPSTGKTFVFSLKSSANCTFKSLSESDKEHLRGAFGVIKNLSFQQIRKLTHEDAAYIEANPRGLSGSPLMSYGMLFDSPNYETAEVVEFASKHR
ncbi:MAG: SocA family protein [Alphaproteobacteria bacterium]|nr:SocA family protein [Alphaproteobacteria bacterium]